MLPFKLRRGANDDRVRVSKLSLHHRNTEVSPEFGADSEHTAARQNNSKLASTPHRILICRPNGRLGNTLLLTPLVQEMERLFPGAELDIVSACPAAREVFLEYPSVRTVHQLPRLGVRRPVNFLSKFLAARNTPYDLVIDPCPRSWSSRFWTRNMHSGADKIGFQSSKKTTGVNYRVPEDGAPRHMAQYPVYLLRQVVDQRFENDAPEAMPTLDIRLTAAEREFGAQKLRQLFRNFDPYKPVVGVFLNATRDKRLAVTFWRQLVDRFLSESPGVQVFEMIAANQQQFLPECPSYYSTNIRRIAAVMNATNCFVSADCGLMHLSAATDTATIGLFSVTDSEKYAPYGDRNIAIQVDERNPISAIDKIAKHFASVHTQRVAKLAYPTLRMGSSIANLLYRVSDV
jgi:ADP-heptose:LPS heptosyltransferase